MPCQRPASFTPPGGIPPASKKRSTAVRKVPAGRDQLTIYFIWNLQHNIRGRLVAWMDRARLKRGQQGRAIAHPCVRKAVLELPGDSAGGEVGAGTPPLSPYIPSCHSS